MTHTPSAHCQGCDPSVEFPQNAHVYLCEACQYWFVQNFPKHAITSLYPLAARRASLGILVPPAYHAVIDAIRRNPL